MAMSTDEKLARETAQRISQCAISCAHSFGPDDREELEALKYYCDPNCRKDESFLKAWLAVKTKKDQKETVKQSK